MLRSSQDPIATLTLRVAAPEDLPSVIRLAALDCARPPQAPVLLAELDDELCVAVSLVDYRTVADPFRPTEAIRALALARASQSRAAARAA